MIDLYCERQGAEFWAEPVNALTNLAFLVAAWVSLVTIRRSGIPAPGAIVLPIWMACIAIGSGLFHTFATTWARVLDVVPIFLFQLCYIWQYSRRVMGAEKKFSALLAGGFSVATWFSRGFPEQLNGSLAYAPSLLVLIGLGLYHYETKKRERDALLVASGLFLLSLFFRTIDLAICPLFPLGTHFLWHLLNSAVLTLVMKALIRNWA